MRVNDEEVNDDEKEEEDDEDDEDDDNDTEDCTAIAFVDMTGIVHIMRLVPPPLRRLLPPSAAPVPQHNANTGDETRKARKRRQYIEMKDGKVRIDKNVKN
jgi:hypothetical protein